MVSKYLYLLVVKKGKYRVFGNRFHFSEVSVYANRAVETINYSLTNQAFLPRWTLGIPCVSITWAGEGLLKCKFLGYYRLLEAKCLVQSFHPPSQSITRPGLTLVWKMCAQLRACGHST